MGSIKSRRSKTTHPAPLGAAAALRAFTSLLLIPGHEIVATIAQIHLHPQVRDKLCGILPEAAHCHLAPIAAWADTIRRGYPGTAQMHYVNRESGMGVVCGAWSVESALCERRSRASLVGCGDPSLLGVRGSWKQRVRWGYEMGTERPSHAPIALPYGGSAPRSGGMPALRTHAISLFASRRLATPADLSQI